MFDHSFSSISRDIRSSVAGYSTERAVQALKGPEMVQQQEEEKDKIFDCEILNATTVSIEPEDQNYVEEPEYQTIECFKCDGTKLNKKGTQPCKKCGGTGIIKTQFSGDLKSII